MTISLFDAGLLGGDLPKVDTKEPSGLTVPAQPTKIEPIKTVPKTDTNLEATTLWQMCLEHLKAEVPELDFNLWLRPLKPRLDGGHLVLLAINDKFISRVNGKYLQSINQILLRANTGLLAKVQMESTPKSSSQGSSKRIKSKSRAKIEESYAINDDCTFENFVRGKANQLAYKVCLEIAKRAGQESLVGNLLFIHGSSGLGKTHLMQAVAHRYQKAGFSYCYFTKDHFFQTAIQAMRGGDGGVDDLAKRIGRADLLMIDDVHMINEKNGPKVSQFLMTLFEVFTKGDKRLILASDRPPAQMQDFDTRFLSRFAGGLTVSIEPPEIEMRVEILQKKAAALQLDLPRDCALLIAKNAPADIRSLEGALNQVRANAMLTDGEIDLNLVSLAIRDHVEARARAVSAESIRDVVAKYYDISVKDLLGKKRSQNIVRPRQMAMALVRELTCDSFPEIAVGFGRDHSTVIHACQQIKQLRLSEPVLERDYQALMATLRFV